MAPRPPPPPIPNPDNSHLVGAIEAMIATMQQGLHKAASPTMMDHIALTLHSLRPKVEHNTLTGQPVRL